MWSPCGFKIIGMEKRDWNLDSSAAGDLGQLSF